MGTLKPQPRLLLIWRITLTAVMVLPAFLNALLFPASSRIWFWITAAWALLFLALYLVYLPLCYQRLSFSVNGERIQLYSGVLYSRTRTIPVRNVQYTTIYRSPLDWVFGLCSLVVVAAGGRITLPGLRPVDAERLASTLTDFWA